MRDYAQVSADGNINLDITRKALENARIDTQGFDDLDRKYLNALIKLHGGGPAGIEAIAASLSEDKGTLEDVVEPYLLEKGFIIRTPKGRVACETSYKHLNISFGK